MSSVCTHMRTHVTQYEQCSSAVPLSSHPQELWSWRNALLLPPLWSADASLLWLRNCLFQTHTRIGLAPHQALEQSFQRKPVQSKGIRGREGKRKEEGKLPSSPISNSPPKTLQAQDFGPRVWDPGQTETSQHGLQGRGQRLLHSWPPRSSDGSNNKS